LVSKIENFNWHERHLKSFKTQHHKKIYWNVLKRKSPAHIIRYRRNGNLIYAVFAWIKKGWWGMYEDSSLEICKEYCKDNKIPYTIDVHKVTKINGFS